MPAFHGYAAIRKSGLDVLGVVSGRSEYKNLLVASGCFGMILTGFMSENTPPIIVKSKVLVPTLIIANEELVLFCKNLAVKVIDALSHWFKNMLLNFNANLSMLTGKIDTEGS